METPIRPALSMALLALALAACGDGGPAAAPTSLAPFAVGAMEEFEATEDGGPAPDIALVDETGAPETLADVMGARATLVNLWATWCAPCIIEMPALNELAADYADDGLAVVAINLDDEAQKGLDFYAQRGLTAMDFHHDPDLVAPSVFGTESLPLTVIYDASGVEIGRTWGAPEWAGEEGRALIEAALAMGGDPAS